MRPDNTVSKYLASFDASTRVKLKSLMAVISQLAPAAKLGLAYGIPTYKLNGKNLVHVAAYATHIGVYPGPEAVAEFLPRLKAYKTAKGTIQFPLDKPLPMPLIKDIVNYSINRLGGQIKR